MSGAITVIDTDAVGLPAEATDPALPPSGAWTDLVGVVASVGCAIHCAAMPFVIAYLPALGLSFLADEAFHKWMAVGCFVIALLAFIPGLRKHRRWTPVAIASVGLAMISVAAFGFAGECCPACETQASAAPTGAAVCTDAGCTACPSRGHEPAETTSEISSASLAATTQPATWLSRFAPLLTPIGGVVLVSAHLLNRRFGCLCGCCESGHVEEVAG